MSLQCQEFPPLPEDTARVTRRAFRKGHPYLTIGDRIGHIFEDEDFQDLYELKGAPAVSPAQLILVLIFQAMEDLSDREAADAVRGRLEWKYALHLPLEDPGFDFSVLSEFRDRLVENAAAKGVLDRVLERMQSLGLLRERGSQRTDSTQVIGATRSLSRLELVMESMRLALEALAQVAPEWLQGIALEHWWKRYALAWRGSRLPKGKEKRRELAASVGEDGAYLLQAIAAEGVPAAVRELPAIELLAQVWAQQYEQGVEGWRWREAGTLPPGSELICTPHDPEVRHTEKRYGKGWKGYKVHFSETCEQDRPRLITQVEVTPSTLPDVRALSDIQKDLARRECLPGKQYVDAGYVAGPTLVSSQEDYGIELIGPMAADSSWQARQEGGLTVELFQIDWEQQQATCPEGQVSATWSESHDEYNRPVIHMRFPAAVCQVCVKRPLCTRSEQGRSLKLRQHFRAIQAARERQQSQEFWDEYSRRSGIEGTVSVATRKHGARRSRYIGLGKTELQEVLLAVAINLERAARWLMGERPATTRVSHFAALAPV